MAFKMTQHVIDEHTYELIPRPLGTPWECAYCGSSTQCRIFSHQCIRGQLFYSLMGQQGFSPSRVLILCDTCWPRWLMWRARFGYDLHSHSVHIPCGPTCLSERGSRQAQFVAQMSLFGEPEDRFFAQKSIDFQPTVNGSPLIMAERFGFYMYRPFTRQNYYESIGTVEELLTQILFNAQLMEIGYPRPWSDQYLMVFEVFEGAYAAPKGVLAPPKPGEKSLGLHCVMWAGYTDGAESLNFLNSWGSSWGDKGYGSVSADYLRKYHYETFVTRRARYGPYPWKFSNVMPGSLSHRQLGNRLMVENPRFVYRLGDSRHNEDWKLELYYTLSPTTNEPVECFIVRNGYGLKMGWSFVRHGFTSQPRVSQILELFVWPTFRRMGIGTLLEQVALEAARQSGATKLELVLHEADSVVGTPRAAARHFAASNAYSWRWRNGTAPRSTGTAVKSV